MADDERKSTGPPFRGRLGSESRGSFRPDDRKEEAPDALPDAPSCPFCDGEETELMSAFGSHASVSTYWCRSCRSPFELMKWG